MTTLKVKELIDVLSPNEVRSFRLYLKSPLYNFSLLEFEKDSEEESLYRQKSLSERNVKKAYSFTMIKSSAKENSEKARSFMNKYRSEEIAHLFNARQHSRLAQLNYTGLLKSLDQFYFVRKLQS